MLNPLSSLLSLFDEGSRYERLCLEAGLSELDEKGSFVFFILKPLRLDFPKKR